ncbi:MAG: uridine phosphorylase [Thermoleophilaceae bacterium]|nr:uridine phosphorylase [Thermoleophilaceae bacterium]
MADLADAPILEFDPSPTAVIEPSEHIDPIEIPSHAVLCFFQDVIAKMVEEFDGKEIDEVKSEIGLVPVYQIEYRGTPLAVVHPGVGAPLAVAFAEELIARGVRAFVACGGAGVLVPDVALGHVVVPTAAIRDEGTSYHYLPASRTVEPTPDAVAAILETLTTGDIAHVTGTTWTTDALYRETREKMARRVAEGCLTVEMEAAAFFALARFRGVSFGQVLYAGDDLSGDAWDQRGWDDDTTSRELLFHVAAESVLRIR